jgi:putative transposase
VGINARQRRRSGVRENFTSFRSHEDAADCFPPGIKKVKQYSSFTLKQAGWKYEGGNRIVIQGTTYKFSLSRPVEGDTKTVTVKRDSLGQLWLCLSVVTDAPVAETKTGLCIV